MFKVSRIVWAAASLLGLFTVFVLAQSFATRYQAARFLRDVAALRPGQASTDDLLRLRGKYLDFATVADSGCDQRSCRIYFRFDNRWLIYTHAAPGTLFSAGVRASDGKIDQINLGIGSGVAYTAEVYDDAGEPSVHPPGISYRTSTPGVLVLLLVHLTPESSEELRQQAYRFNLACLTRLGGCNNARDMLPEVPTPE